VRLPSHQVSAEFARLNERGRAFRAAAAKTDYVAVCLLGYEGSVPRHFGDNQGAWPIRVATTTRPQDIAKEIDRANPLHAVKVHDYVWTPTEAHAKRLKAGLDKLLLGTTEESRALRHGWRDCADPAVAWAILLEDALRDIRRREAFEVFDDDERRRRIISKVRRRY
jgi:hypothetical protein